MKENIIQSTLSPWYAKMRSSMGEHILLAFVVFLLPLLLLIGIWGYVLKASLSSPLRASETPVLQVQKEAFLRSRAELLRAEQEAQKPFSASGRDIFRE